MFYLDLFSVHSHGECLIGVPCVLVMTQDKAVSYKSTKFCEEQTSDRNMGREKYILQGST